MRHALSLSLLSPPKPTNYRVGALLVDPSTGTILSTGYTLELPGNTHAEQCCFTKLAQAHSIPESSLADSDILPPRTVLYTTMEPCSERLSGNVPCVQRILALGGKVATVYVGVKEPETFVGDNKGRRMLEEKGIRVVSVPGMEEDILRVATAGHGGGG